MYIRRRNAEPIRVKRQNKSKKVSEALFSSSFFQYFQVLVIWVVILACDMILDMRFEYAWPCWLLMRSSHDTYKCGGLLLAMFFFAVALVADIIVYIIMPMSWVLFLGSSLVWLQFAFQADRGFCLPTVALCAIFLYVEVSIRFRDYARMYPIVAQILKPFASHCIGYPMVTIGFHIKAFISGKISQRNRLRVREKNQFYFNLVDQALPEDVRRARAAMYQNGLPNGTPNGHISGPTADEEYLERASLAVANASYPTEGNSSQQRDKVCASNGLTNAPSSSHSLLNGSLALSSSERSTMICCESRESAVSSNSSYCNMVKSSRATTNSTANVSTSEAWCSPCTSCPTSHVSSLSTCTISGITTTSTSSLSLSYLSASGVSSTCTSGAAAVSPSSSSTLSSSTMHSHHTHQLSQYASTAAPMSTSLSSLPLESNARTSAAGGTPSPQLSTQQSTPVSTSTSPPQFMSSTATTKGKSKDETLLKMESENKRLKGELQSCRSSENELRSQVQQLNAQERATATELQRLKQENESLQSRNQSLNSRLQDERNKVQAAEKRLADERRSKHSVEVQLEKEKKSHKEEVDAARQAAQAAAAQAASAKNECSEACKQRRREIDNDMKQLRRELRAKDDLARNLDAELAYLRSQVSEHKDVLSARDSLRDQQQHLSEKLREENRFKQDLLTAYHEARSEKNRLEQRVQQLECELMQMRNFVSNILSNSPSFVQPSSPAPYLATHSVTGNISPTLPMVGSNISSSSRLFPTSLDPSPPPSMTLGGSASFCMSGAGNVGSTSFFTPICTPTATCCGGAGQHVATMSSASPQLVSSPSASSAVGSSASMRAPSRGD